MKRLILLSTFLFSILIASAQTIEKVKEKDLPAKVKETFTRLYAHVDKAKWAKKGSIYEVEFMVNRKDVSAYFDSEGNWLNTSFIIEEKLIRTGLPSTSINYIDTKFKTAQISSAHLLLSPRGKMFMVTIDADGEKKTKEKIALYFAENGAFLRQENL